MAIYLFSQEGNLLTEMQCICGSKEFALPARILVSKGKLTQVSGIPLDTTCHCQRCGVLNTVEFFLQ